MKKTFTIEEIRKYLKGNLYFDGNGKPCREKNFALEVAIGTLEDKEDGIAEVLAREKWHIEKRPLDRFIGVPCALIAGGCSGTIEKIDNKKRKLLINIPFSSGRHSFWISTKTFFDKWYWGPHCEVKNQTKS